jgi:hypothetical protein
MDRLTKRSKANEGIPIKHLNIMHMDTTSEDTLTEILDRLAYYEDLSEQEMLIELPCKVGDTIYVVSPLYTFPKKYIHERKICGFLTINSNWYFETEVFSHRLDEFGVNVFLTRDDAELKLKEMK